MSETRRPERLEQRLFLSAFSFQPPKTYATGNAPTSVAVADLGNGHPDLVVANNGGINSVSDTVSVLLGNGDGTFQPQQTYTTGMNPDSVAVADLGNGEPDLVVANEDLAGAGSVSVLLGNGNGTFQPQQTYATGVNPIAVAVADLGNGHPDLIVANQTSQWVSIFLGNGDGTFQPQEIVDIPGAAQSLAVADLGNGHPDLIVGTIGANDVTVLLGNGDGTFQAPQTYATGMNPVSVAVADLGNGHPDIVTANNTTAASDISVLLGNGNGTFQPQRTYAINGQDASSIAVGNLGNGKPDLVVAYEVTNALGTSDMVSVLAGNGDGTFGAPQTLVVGPDPDFVTVADVTGSGQADIVTANSGNNTVSVLRNRSTTTTSPLELSAGLIASGSDSTVAGTQLKLKERLTLTPAAGTAGAGSATILLSPDETAGDSVLTLASETDVIFKNGKAKGFNLKLPKSILASVAPGTYHVLIQLADGAGAPATVDSGQALTVVAPAVDLTGSFVKTPTSVSAGKKFAVTFMVANSSGANVSAVGLLPFDLDTSPDGLLSDAVPLKNGSERINLKPGKSIKITISATISTSAFLVVSLDTGNAAFSDDINAGNNSFATANAIQIG